MKYLHYFASLTLILLLSAAGLELSAQTAVGIGSTTFTPDANSVLDVQSSTTGVLLPRMTIDPTVAGNNDDGLMYFNTSTQTYKYYDETANVWKSIATASGNDYILNQTSLQTPASYNISGSGQIGTTLTVGSTASVVSTLAVGQGIRVGDAALTPAAGQGNILTTVDGGWIGRGNSATTPRIAFDATTSTENIKVYPIKQMQVLVATASDANSNNSNTAVTVSNTGASTGVGIKLSGNRGLAPGVGATREVGFIDFENTNPSAVTLGRLGVTNPSSNTAGSFQISLLSGGNLEERLVLSHAGNLTIDGKFNSQGIQETSDARFKKNIVEISNALSTVLNLEGVTYNWRTEEFPERSFSDRMEYGVIAQQIEIFVPELVSTDEKGYKSVQYSHMVPLLLEAIKEQQEIINSQSKELGVLKASVDAISEYIKTAEK
ncbi:MAG: tail fiber domain-containing protein [Flavobacteriales bacterium]|nr:tail fiber domain-containing protein [Flavobacteriales bacterium]